VKVLDFRSDTVTRPTPAMRQAMAGAEVGDDVYFEDPTVNRLQAWAAEQLGKEAGLFVPSGTMGNQVCVRTLTRPGDVVMAGEGAHLLLYEQGAAAALAGVQIETLGRNGLFDAGDVAAAVHPDEPHYAATTLVTVENTHNAAGGRIFPLDAIREIAATAREHDMALHLDGARLFNAVVATGIPAAEWAEPFDTVTYCLSKGLGAPVGSIVCSSRARMRALVRARKLLGGGMRQVGILAAAGLHALDHHVERLADDHRNARRLAEGLAALDVEVRETPETNMVYFRMDDTAGFLRETRARDLWINPMAEGTFRAVTHLDLDADDVEDALGRAAEALKALRR
jgi:threonine aldolase